MAGSDLDGDLYWVTWHPNFVQHFRPDNYPAMDYTGQAAKEQDGPITVRNMIDHTIHFIQTDITSIVSRTHLCMADQEFEGIFSEKCLLLDKLHSRAVDASKSGDQVALPRSLKQRAYPDFLNKSDHKVTSRSERILGKLYRQYNDMYETLQEMSKHNDCKSIGPWKCEYISGQNYSIDLAAGKKVQTMYDKFEHTLLSLCKRYKMEEVELLSGNVISNSKQRIHKDTLQRLKYEVKDDVRQLFADIKVENVAQTKQLRKMAVAAFRLHSEGKISSLSFPWLFAKWLIPDVPSRSTHSQYTQLYLDNGKSVQAFLGVNLQNDVGQLNYFIKPLNDEHVTIFTHFPWLILLYLYFGVAIKKCQPERLLEADLRKLADVIIDLSTKADRSIDFTQIPSRSGNILDRLFRRLLPYFGLDEKSKLAKKIKQKLLIRIGDEDLEKAGMIVCKLILFSLHQSAVNGENPFRHIHRIYLSITVADIMIKHKPIALIETIQKETTCSNATATKIYTLTRSTVKLFTNDPDVINYMKSVDYALEGNKITVTCPRIQLQDIEEIIEELNMQKPDRYYGSNKHNHDGMECYYCHEIGHIKWDCPKLAKKNATNRNRTRSRSPPRSIY